MTCYSGYRTPARDVYQWLYDNGVEMEAKGIAVGVRLEHPSMLIDQIQYHNKNGRGKYLPAAEYSFVTQAEGRGVYSFCMCPGGFVVPAASGASNCSKRHESQQPWLQMEQFRNGSRNQTGRPVGQ